MSHGFEEFLVHSVTVSTATGVGARGIVYSEPATVGDVFVEEKRKAVLGPDAKQVVSEATIFDFNVANAAKFTPESTVTLPSGRTTRVISVSNLSASSESPAHLEVFVS